ncbi:MAG: hypothetical protein K9K86_00465 [Pseudomonadales bacterium]|nr:hypothetical protein [Pseudomonadales bacterium]
MIISVHLPKTAGSSFLMAMEEHFDDRLLKDYGDYPINHSNISRNLKAVKNCLCNGINGESLSTADAVHGHFMPLKYLLYKAKSKKQFVMWMRDPVERLASHYYYWIRNYDHESAGQLRRRVVEEEWSLERFCLGPELRNFYSKFLWGFPIRKFDFIGITEHFDTEIDYFAKNILGASLISKEVNVNPDKKMSIYIKDQNLRDRIGEYHKTDMYLYCRALAIRQQRCE